MKLTDPPIDVGKGEVRGQGENPWSDADALAIIRENTFASLEEALEAKSASDE